MMTTMTLIKASGGFVRLQLGLFARRVSWSEPIYKSGCSHYRPFTAITQEDYRHDNSKSNSSGGFVVQDLPSYNVQFIGGRWTAPTPNQDLVGTIGVFDSNTGQEVASVPRGSEEDTILAIKAAKDAFQVWREVPLSKRIQFIRMFLSKFEAKRDEIVNRLTVELGCTTKFARQVQFGASVVNVKTFLRLLEDSSSNNNKGNSKSAGNRFEFEYSAGRCTVVKEPIGVVGAITPWNYPPLQILLKVVPALLVGCTVVLKPSEVTPLCSYSVVEAFDEAIKEINDDDIPSGIFNMVMGYGPECGQILASHPDVNLLSFTGSTRGGQILSELASKTMKPITTELGGKSAAILLDDADYETTVPEFVKQLMGNTGQTCDALSRMLVPRKDYEDVVDIAKRVFEEERVGTSTNPDATMGPLASKLQYDRVQFALEKGVEEGARVVVGGPGRPVDPSLPENGYFVQPTLFAGVSNDMTIAREEIFGPVLSLIAYDTEEEAIMIANDTVYGLSNAVASSDMSRALKVASRLESGMVMVNGTTVDTLAPFGGCKMSGNGRECGAAGLEEFLVTKTINIPIEKYRSAIAKTKATGQVRNMSTLSFMWRSIPSDSSRSFSTIVPSVEPMLDMKVLDERLNSISVSKIARQLSEEGYFTTTNFLSSAETRALREQSIALWNEGRYEQSWSESIDDEGVAHRFDKEGVFACEPDGADYETAPDLLVWMSWLLQTLPPKLNAAMDANGNGSLDLSSRAFNAKLAVTKPGGSIYPLHIDNPQGLAVNDTRKLTAIIYLNDEYEEGVDGGELRIYLKGNVVKDLTPIGGRLLLFWSDLIPHEVLPTSPDTDRYNEKKDRYALTMWIPTNEAAQIHPPTSQFIGLRRLVSF